MRTYEPQHGYVYEGPNGKSFHIRYYVHEGGKRKQRSAKLCSKDIEHSSKDAPYVIALAEAFILQINQANAVNDAQPSHVCPICKNKCKRTIQGKFTKKAA